MSTLVKQLTPNPNITYDVDNGNVLLKKTDTKETLYVGVQDVAVIWPPNEIRKHNRVKQLHILLMKVSKDLGSPMVNLPTRCPEISKYVIPLECFDGQPLSEKRNDFFFDQTPVLDTTEKTTKLKETYATLALKKIILSVLNTVRACRDSDFGPVLKLERMFISKDGSQVIFSHYEKGAITDASAVINLFNVLYTRKGNESETLDIEINNLNNWIADHLFTSCDIRDVFGIVLFWTPRMRISFTKILSDSILEGWSTKVGTQVHLVSEYAFLTSSNNNWLKAITNSPPPEPVLNELLKRQDIYYSNLDPNTSSQLRIEIASIGPNIGWLHLACGITRLRDGYEHVDKFAQLLEDAYKIAQLKNIYPVDDLYLQGIFQNFFPRHIFELAKSIGLTYFNPVPIVSEFMRSL